MVSSLGRRKIDVDRLIEIRKSSVSKQDSKKPYIKRDFTCIENMKFLVTKNFDKFIETKLEANLDTIKLD